MRLSDGRRADATISGLPAGPRTVVVTLENTATGRRTVLRTSVRIR
jgi:hypothetical protein